MQFVSSLIRATRPDTAAVAYVKEWVRWEQLAKGVVLKRAALILAAWCHYLELAPSAAFNYNVQDEMKQLLIEKATESANGDPLAFLKIKSIFGDLAEEKKFTDKYLFFLNAMRKDGIAKVIKAIAEY